MEHPENRETQYVEHPENRETQNVEHPENRGTQFAFIQHQHGWCCGLSRTNKVGAGLFESLILNVKCPRCCRSNTFRFVMANCRFPLYNRRHGQTNITAESPDIRLYSL